MNLSVVLVSPYLPVHIYYMTFPRESEMPVSFFCVPEVEVMSAEDSLDYFSEIKGPDRYVIVLKSPFNVVFCHLLI